MRAAGTIVPSFEALSIPYAHILYIDAGLFQSAHAPKTNLVPVELSGTRPGSSCLAIS